MNDHLSHEPTPSLTCPPIALLTDLTCAYVIADKAYDTHAILDHIEATGAAAIIPKRDRMNRRRAFDPEICKPRNMIERTIGK